MNLLFPLFQMQLQPRSFAIMKYVLALFCLLLFLPQAYADSADQIVKDSIVSRGKKRTFYLYVPKSIKADNPAPLIVMLHGSGRTGEILVEKWKELADKGNIILVGPDASDTQRWRVPEDGPDFIHELVEALKAKYPINARRVYLFGHSAGAISSIYMSLLESRYFAATALHAGALNLGKQELSLIESAERKIPFRMFVGTDDPFFPLAAVRATRDALKEQGFPVELTEIKGHTHDYYGRSAEINKSAWEFLSKQMLSEDPEYKQYNFSS
jgi:poly(3-hydroxybutyrate) depolymerase